MHIVTIQSVTKSQDLFGFVIQFAFAEENSVNRSENVVDYQNVYIYHGILNEADFDP